MQMLTTMRNDMIASLAAVLALCCCVARYGGGQVGAFSVTTTHQYSNGIVRRNSAPSSLAVHPSLARRTLPPSRQHQCVSTESTTSVLYSDNSGNNENTRTDKKAGGLEESMRNKLLTETIAPWRGLRLFFYAALGFGALIGGFITLSGTLAALSGAGANPDAVDMGEQYKNLAIDFGAVFVFAFLAKFDLDKGGELDEEVKEKVAKKQERKKVVKGIQEREQQLGTLGLEIQVSMDGATKTAPVRQIQSGARQHMIVVIGPKKACRDALIGANLLKFDFSMSNILVAPYETDAVKDPALDSRDGGGGEGFGELPVYESQPYVARPRGEGWAEYAQAEMNDAVKQNGEQTREEGIAIVVASNGKVIRRGVGKVPWRQMVEQLEEAVSSG